MSEYEGAERSTTDTLRQLLDARGVKWHGVEDSTYWGEVLLTRRDGSDPVYKFRAHKTATNRLSAHLLQVTPEQAVAATLGQGTCEMEFRRAAQFGDPATDDYFEIGMFCCSCCGTETYGMWNDDDECRELPRYCPNCGRRVAYEQ